MTITRTRPPRIPVAATRLRIPVWQRSQQRMREKWGFDLGSPDMLARVRSLVAEQPADADRVLLLAAALATTGEPDLAEQQARRALELSPDLARARTTLATLLVTDPGPPGADADARRAEGLEHARRAAALDPGDPSVLFNLGLAEWFTGDRHASREAFDQARDVLAGEAAPAGAGSGGQPAGTGPPRRWWRLGRRD